MSRHLTSKLSAPAIAGLPAVLGGETGLGQRCVKPLTQLIGRVDDRVEARLGDHLLKQRLPRRPEPLRREHAASDADARLLGLDPLGELTGPLRLAALAVGED